MADAIASSELTPKQESFVLAYLETSNATEAYRRAYNAENMSEGAINVEAHRVLNHPKVALRLQVLQERSAAKVVLTRGWVLEKLMRNVDKAIELEDVNGSNKALELLGKTDELQMFVERQNVTSDNRHHHSAEPVSPFADFIAGAIGKRTKDETSEPVQN